jgi:hypothetical protein
MLIAIVNGQTVEQVGDYQTLFPNTSFPSSGPTAEWMVENSCMYVTVYLPYDASTQYLENVAPYIDGNTVYTVVVAQLTPEMIEQQHQSEAAQNKTKAANLLSQTDWTAIPDVSDPIKSDPYLVNQSEFVAWRSTIRAIAVTPTYDAVFPNIPSEIWSNQPASSFTIGAGTGSLTINI